MTRAVAADRLVLRALRADALAVGCTVVLVHEAETPWASATFVGAQHRVRVSGTALDAWLAALPEADLPVRRHLVASCAVERDGRGALLTLLVLDAS